MEANDMDGKKNIKNFNGTFIQGQTVLVKCKYCGGQKDKSKICPGCGAR